MKLSSPSFKNGEMIPIEFKKVSPELLIEDIPKETKSLVLIMDDPDAPVGVWDHWIMWNIPVVNKIEKNSNIGIEGVNSWGRNDYGGPNPPSGTHRYFFKLYALDLMLDLSKNSNKSDLIKAMKNHILAESKLIGLFSS